MGCDDGILLSDKKFAGSDTWATSYALAQAIKKIGAVDLIICGERATDGDTGQVGPGIAAFLDLPVATYISRIYDVSAEGLRVKRLVEGGAEILWTPLPAVLTVVKEIAYPRLPTLRGKQRAKQTELPVWKPADIGVDASQIGGNGRRAKLVKLFQPVKEGKCEIVEGDSVEEAAASLAVRLREVKLL